MRRLCLLFTLFIAGDLFAQTAVLQWQKNYGGSRYDNAARMTMLPDGNIVMLGNTSSNDGDIIGFHSVGGSSQPDICVIKSDPSGNIIWEKTYGGQNAEIPNKIISTKDGGLIIVGYTTSTDGDVTGNHGNGDCWVVKLDALGNMAWQKCYGGSLIDEAYDILEIAGGYMVVGSVNSNDGDVSGNHALPGKSTTDVWVFKIDLSGNLLWQKCYGGSAAEAVFETITPTLDGNFLVTTTTSSSDGDVSNYPPGEPQDAWIFKISPAGAMIWDKCIGGIASDIIEKVIPNNDGSFFMTGVTYSVNLPGAFPQSNPPGDGWGLLLDAAGNILQMKILGGASGDHITDAVKTPDGGYLMTGYTQSANSIVCQKHLLYDIWLLKMDAAWNITWSRTFGGSKNDQGKSMAIDASGDCFVLSSSFSNDEDIPNNYSPEHSDIILARFSFTGALTHPLVTIGSEKDSFACAGSSAMIVATTIEGGSAPHYQWQLNGSYIGPDNDTIWINNIQNNDIVSCTVTSNSSCVDIPTANSNTIKLKVGSLLPPKNFLPKDTALCSFQKIRLQANTKFESYLWSTGSTDESIVVKQPGIYWLDIVNRFQCTARDSIVIFPKTCIEGIFIPNAFTPNKDGKNDLFMPIMNVDVKQYRFIIYDRWGRIVFETTTLNHGWDGTIKNMPFNTGVFAWQCQYQLEGEAPTSKRGTVLLLR